MAAPLHVCFVCTGNICRSPTAEIVFRSMVRDAGLEAHITCSSAGLGDWHVGDGADRRALAALRNAGYDGSQHHAQQWSEAWWGSCDVIVAMDGGHLRELQTIAPDGREVLLLRDLDPSTAGRHLDVPDPYFGGTGGFDDVLLMIESACGALLDDLRLRLAP